MTSARNYVVATIKPWNVDAFGRLARRLPGRWHLIESRERLTIGALRRLKPRYVFFPHWSWKVPKAMLTEFECVCFHMTDVPYGRGGSPLQNLIVRGRRTTKLSALRMTGEMDAGPVYLKRSLSLGGRAVAIYGKVADLVFGMIAEIAAREPAPVPQRGAAVIFTRRTPNQSRLPTVGRVNSIYDHIRMLDAPTYPPAFVEWGDFRLEFSRAKLTADGEVSAQVRIREKQRRKKHG